MPRVCNVSTEALLSWGQATVNHGAQKVKCLFTCDIGFIGHDSGSILFVYRIFRERKKSASDGIRMHFFSTFFSSLWCISTIPFVPLNYVPLRIEISVFGWQMEKKKEYAHRTRHPSALALVALFNELQLWR